MHLRMKLESRKLQRTVRGFGEGEVLSCWVPRWDSSGHLPFTSASSLLSWWSQPTWDLWHLPLPGVLGVPCAPLGLGDAAPVPPSPLTDLLLHLPPVKAIIEHEMKNGIAANRIILGGFSQVSCGGRARVGSPLPPSKDTPQREHLRQGGGWMLGELGQVGTPGSVPPPWH